MYAWVHENQIDIDKAFAFPKIEILSSKTMIYSPKKKNNLKRRNK